MQLLIWSAVKQLRAAVFRAGAHLVARGEEHFERLAQKLGQWAGANSIRQLVSVRCFRLTCSPGRRYIDCLQQGVVVPQPASGIKTGSRTGDIRMTAQRR